MVPGSLRGVIKVCVVFSKFVRTVNRIAMFVKGFVQVIKIADRLAGLVRSLYRTSRSTWTLV